MLIWSLILQYRPTIQRAQKALSALSNPPTLLLCRARYLPPFTDCISASESLSSLQAHRSLHEIPPLPICYLSFTLTLQHVHFDLLLSTFLLNPVSELRLLFIVASDMPGNEFGTLNKMTSNSFSSFRSRLKTHHFPSARQ